MLEGLLEQQTDLNSVEIMTDTASASDMVFGFILVGSLKLGTVQASELIHRSWTNGLSVHFRSVGLQIPISS